MKGIIFIAFLFTSSITISLSDEHVRNEYDSTAYLLRLQWLPGKCKALDEMGFTCIESKVVDDNWTIHGLWTDGDCPDDGDHPFREDLLKSEIINELKTYWVDIKEDGDDIFKFWRDEFRKHGCVTNWKEVEYFNRALSVYKQYDPENKLTQAGIIPGGSYSQEQFQNVFDTFVLLICNKDNSINELQFCFDEEFNAVNCQEKNRCPNGDILYMKKNEESTLSMMMKRRVSW